jgi:hypothetical protein
MMAGAISLLCRSDLMCVQEQQESRSRVEEEGEEIRYLAITTSDKWDPCHGA